MRYLVFWPIVIACSLTVSCKPDTSANATIYKGTITLTFDGPWGSIYPTAYPIMAANNLVGTVFVEPSWVDQAPFGTTSQLKALQSAGWEIQAYSGTMNGPMYDGVCGGVNLVTGLSIYGSAAVTNQLTAIKNLMASKGFTVTALAPNQRAWNSTLKNLAKNAGFTSVRSVHNTTDYQPYPVPYQTYPITDPLYVDNGGLPSLQTSTASVQTLRESVDAVISEGSWFIAVIHNVGTKDTNSTSTAVFTDFCEYMKSKVDAGELRVVTFTAGLTPVRANATTPEAPSAPY